jgi:oligopeptide transport system substrate-binding protein
MNTKKWLTILGVLMIVAMIVPLLAACGPEPTEPPPPEVEPTKAPEVEPTAAPVAPTDVPPTPEPVPTEVPVEPAVLRVNLGTEPPTLDPALATDTTSVAVTENIFVGLTNVNAKTDEVEPELAASWDVSADGTVYTFNLRDDVYWVNYDPATESFERLRPVTAYDVEYGIRRTVMPETASDYSYVLYILKGAYDINTTEVPTDTYDIEELGVRALDDYTLEVELENAAAFFPAIASMWVMYPVPKETIEEYGTEWTEPGAIVTNGAMALAEWTHDAHMTLIKNPHYFNADAVEIDVVDMVMIVEASTAFAMYENDELDTVPVPSDEIDRVKADPVLSQELRIAPDACTYYYGFTTTKPPFDNVHVRRAFSHAVDREGLVINVTKGGQLPAHSFAPGGIFGNVADDMTVGIFSDTDAAKAELAEAGYPDCAGFPAVTLMHNTSEGHTRIAQAIQQMWKETLGCDITIENQEWAVYLNTIGPDTPLEEMPHVWRLGWCADYADQNNWIHEVFNPIEGANRTRISVDDPQVGEFVQEFSDLTIAAGAEQDQDMRLEMYARAEQLFAYEIAAYIPIYYYTSVSVTKPYLERDFPNIGGTNWYQWKITK